MLWKIVPNLQQIDARLREIGTAGYSLVVNVRGLTPEHHISTFPEHWVALYSERQYAVFDPVSIWARLNSGRIRWSEIRSEGLTPVQQFILRRGADYGLVYGGGVSRSEPESRGTFSFLFCARADRELLGEELDVIEESLDIILSAVEAQPALSAEDVRVLSDLARGYSQKEIAVALSLSRETIKKRLEKIRIQLGARNSTHAVSLAQRRGLILSLPDRMPGPDETPEG
ncbi:helix-turn-helix transcriptional regulator [Falsigemmobacter faecalis]|nr:LuxR family transcriptional regulator [Falsigemmobacter faecalis]